MTRRWSGNQKSLGPGLWFPDPRDVVRNDFWSTWDDCISSIEQGRYHRLACEHPPAVGTGSSLLIAPGVAFEDLARIGWNDRISALYNCGF
jgi:hypothetical protein